MNEQPASSVDDERVIVICGGVGAARLLRGLVDIVAPESITAIVNVADDIELHGLHISPDLDTVTYTLADAIDPERGWGLRDESWRAMEALGRYGDGAWFSLGDRDLATHLHRTARLRDGATLTAVTKEITSSWGVGVEVLPVSDDRVSTFVTLAASGEEVPFQRYFVELGHGEPISAIRFDGIDDATPTKEVLEAIDGATSVLIAPSNPFVSVAPVLEIPGIRERLQASKASCAAVSPIIGGKAVKGPAADMLSQLGYPRDVTAIATMWADIADTLVIDDADANLARSVASIGLTPHITPTLMSSPPRRAALARAALGATRRQPLHAHSGTD